MAYEPAAIANYFIEVAEKNGESLTPMKIQKLVYFSHGWHLAFTDMELIDEPVQAWKFGPVIKSLYHDMKSYGNIGVDSPLRRLRRNSSVPEAKSGSIDDIFKQFEFYVPELRADDEYTKPLLDEIWKIYSRFTASQLSNMTHEPGSPWSTVVAQFNGDPPPNTSIPTPLIKEYFVSLESKAKS